MVPVGKGERGERVEEYRGKTLMQTAYKVYAAVLAERLKEEVETKGILPPSQAGFRKSRGTIDQIYVLNYSLNRMITEKKEKMVVLFLDMRAAFNSVDRGILLEGKRGVREW